MEYRGLLSMPEILPMSSMQQLSNDGISFIKKSSTKLCHHIIEINRLISDRINNCKSLFPIWINWAYIKELFIMPNGLTEDGTKAVSYTHLDVYKRQVYDALMKACFMEIAKLYDSSNGVVSIGTLLAKCEENQDLFPKYRETLTVDHDGTTFSYPVPYQHQLKPQEECFFKNRVEADRKLFAAFDIPDADNVPVRVDLTFPEFLDLYQKRFNGLSKKRDNIRMQRNKLYAHNDEQRIVNSENLPDRYPISYPDVQEMIDFALDCTGLILGILTDVNRAKPVSYTHLNSIS